MQSKLAHRVIDFHSHILPGADHGSDGLETSLKQLKIAADAGTETIVATPHFYAQSDNVEAFLARRQKALSQLTAANRENIRIAVGAEVLVFANLENMEGIEELTVQGTDTLLLEMPFTAWNVNLINTVLELNRKFHVVLAHIDRYPVQAVEELLELEVHAQINCSQMVKLKNRKKIRSWLDTGLVVAVGSDLHGCEKKAYKPFIRVQEKYRCDMDGIFAQSAALLEGARLY